MLNPTPAPAPVDFPPDFDPARLDPTDPDMWTALYLDRSVALDDGAKAALLRSTRRRARRFLLPFLRPLARAAIVLLTPVTMLLPRRFAAPRVLHWLIYRGLKRWVAPEANELILRHFHIGTEILGFIRDNVPGMPAATKPLRPRTLADLKPDMFLQHDINLFNFVGQLGAYLQRTGTDLRPPARIDFGAITDGPFDIDPMPDRWSNRVDLQSAVEAYTPLYQFFLGNLDFWRASNSLQLDETVAVLVAKILGCDRHLSFVTNRHPLLPLPTGAAAWRLMLHGLAAEQLHFHLRQWKRAQARGVDLRERRTAARNPQNLVARPIA